MMRTAGKGSSESRAQRFDEPVPAARLAGQRTPRGSRRAAAAVASARRERPPRPHPHRGGRAGQSQEHTSGGWSLTPSQEGPGHDEREGRRHAAQIDATARARRPNQMRASSPARSTDPRRNRMQVASRLCRALSDSHHEVSVASHRRKVGVDPAEQPDTDSRKPGGRRISRVAKQIEHPEPTRDEQNSIIPGDAESGRLEQLP